MGVNWSKKGDKPANKCIIDNFLIYKPLLVGNFCFYNSDERIPLSG